MGLTLKIEWEGEGGWQQASCLVAQQAVEYPQVLQLVWYDCRPEQKAKMTDEKIRSECILYFTGYRCHGTTSAAMVSR